MAKFVLLLIIALSVICMATSFSMTMSNSNNADVDRRSFVNKGTTAAAVVVAGGLLSNPSKSIAADTDTAAAATAEADVAATDADGFFTTESGMKYKVTKEGTGGIPTSGQTVKAHYTGWLDGFDTDKKFDSSRDRGRPFTFSVGKGQVIRGWDESFSSMKVGERRQIILPPRLAYGDRGAGGIIPGGATLYFDVELLGIM